MKHCLAIFFATILALSLITIMAHATIIDLTTKGSSVTVNGAIFISPLDDIKAGTGVIQPFLRIQPQGKDKKGNPKGASSEQGYNTDGRSVEFDTKDKNDWCHSLLLSDLQTNIVKLSGINYYEFVLDTDEPNNKKDCLIALLSLKLFIDPVGNKTGYPNIGKMVYDLDEGANSDIVLDDNLFPGNGKLNMITLIPTSLFGSDHTKYAYLYSKFGEPDGVSGGFEEWANKKSGTFTPSDGIILSGAPVPEPSTLLLLGSGLIGLAGYAKVRFSRKQK